MKQIVMRRIGLGNKAAARGMDALRVFWSELTKTDKSLVGGAAQLAAWKAIAEAADAPDVDFDEPSPSPHTDHREEAAADASPVERRAGLSTNDPDGDPAPVPHEPAGPGAATTAPAEGTLQSPLESAAPASNPPAGAAPTEPAPPQGPQEGAGRMRSPQTGSAPSDLTTRRAEIRRDGDARAAAGTAALTDFLEGLRKAREADLVSTILRDQWREVAKAVDAKARRR